MTGCELIRLTVNGEGRNLEENTTVGRLLAAMGAHSERVAVELNLRILDKSAYDDTILKDGDRLEIIGFVGGGGRGA